MNFLTDPQKHQWGSLYMGIYIHMQALFTRKAIFDTEATDQKRTFMGRRNQWDPKQSATATPNPFL